MHCLEDDLEFQVAAPRIRQHLYSRLHPERLGDTGADRII